LTTFTHYPSNYKFLVSNFKEITSKIAFSKEHQYLSKKK